MNAPPLRTSARQKGFSLVELMVAMVLGLILTGGVISIYISSKQTYRMQDNQSRLQEDGRFALQYLTKDLRMAGYMGCNNLGTITPNIIANPTPGPAPVFDPGTVIEGYDSGTWPASFPTQPTNLVPNTSVIMVRYASASGVFVAQPLPLPAAVILVNANPYGWTADTVLFITDCSSADIFRASGVANAGAVAVVAIAHAADANTTPALSKAYGTDAQIMAFNAYMYYIGSIAGGSSNACPCALYRQAYSTAPAEQLVDNIQNMQITYGVPTTSSPYPVQYVPASASPNWASVVSVRVNLLVTTPDDNLVDTPQSYLFNGTTTTAADRRLYSSFSDTVTLRNRAP